MYKYLNNRLLKTRRVISNLITEHFNELSKMNKFSQNLNIIRVENEILC